MKEHVVLVTGSRYWSDRLVIYDILKELPKDTLIIQGGARGADTLAREVAEELGLEVKTFKAEWDKYGKSAGPIRNQKMLDETHPSLVLVFHSDIEHSKGTKDLVERARKTTIPIRVIRLGIH